MVNRVSFLVTPSCAGQRLSRSAVAYSSDKIHVVADSSKRMCSTSEPLGALLCSACDAGLVSAA